MGAGRAESAADPWSPCFLPQSRKIYYCERTNSHENFHYSKRLMSGPSKVQLISGGYFPTRSEIFLSPTVGQYSITRFLIVEQDPPSAATERKTVITNQPRRLAPPHVPQ